MALIRIEPEPQIKRDRCPNCGGATWMILGYIYADEHPQGLYYADWCEGPHDERRAFVTVSLGDYGDESSTGADRVAFGLDVRCEGFGFSDQPFRDRPDFLGRFVPREEALEWPTIDKLWHICDHLTDDRRFAGVAAWLCGHLDSALEGDDDAPARSV